MTKKGVIKSYTTLVTWTALHLICDKLIDSTCNIKYSVLTTLVGSYVQLTLTGHLILFVNFVYYTESACISANQYNTTNTGSEV